MPTHEVTNQPPPLAGYDASADPALRGVSSMAEQRAFNPWVQGSTPWRPTSPTRGNTRSPGRAWHGLWHENAGPGYRAVMLSTRGVTYSHCRAARFA